MSKTILAFVGETGAGKGEAVEYLKKKLGNKVSVLKFSDALSEVLRIFFDEVKKEDQQWLVSHLRERFGEDILARSLEKKIKNAIEGILLLDGVRMPKDEEMVKRNNGRMVFITAPSRLRWERLQGRGEKGDDKATYEKFLEMENAASERRIKEIGERAEFKIDNSGDWENLHGQIENLIDKLKLQ